MVVYQHTSVLPVAMLRCALGHVGVAWAGAITRDCHLLLRGLGAGWPRLGLCVHLDHLRREASHLSGASEAIMGLQILAANPRLEGDPQEKRGLRSRGLRVHDELEKRGLGSGRDPGLAHG